jgi:hypothetical protein
MTKSCLRRKNYFATRLELRKVLNRMPPVSPQNKKAGFRRPFSRLDTKARIRDYDA